MSTITDKLLKEAGVLKARGLFDKSKRLIKRILLLEPSCAKAYILSGDIERENRNLDAAISFYNKAVKIDEKCFQGWIHLAVCYKNKELLTQAQKAVIQAIKLDSHIPHNYEVFADIMLEKGDINKAFQSIEIGIKRCQNKHRLYYFLAKILMKNGDYKRSKKELMKAIKIKSNFLDAYSLLLSLAQKHDNTREMLKVLSQVEVNCQIKDYRVCINSLAKYFREKADIKHLRIVLKKFILATPSRERISLDCFRAYCALEKYSDAFKVGEGLFSVKKIDGGLSVVCNPWLDDRVAPKSFWKKQFSVVSNTCVENKYKVWKVFYLTLIEKKLDYDKSLIEIKKICRQFKGRYRWMRFSLIPYFFRYDLRYMLKELSGIVDCIPHDYLVRCRNGEALLSAGRTVEGFKQFETAIAMNDSARGDIEAWKGEMLLMTGEYKKAFESLEIAVRLKAACALCWRSVAYFKMGHIQESLNDFGQVVEKFPEDIEARVWKAEILRTLGRFNESLEDLNFIIKNRSDYNFALFNRALVYYELGDYRNMRKDFVKIDSKLIGIISIRLRIKKTKKINSSQIYKILRMGLKMAKGNRRAEKYLLQIQFPEYKRESTGEVLIGL